ncbi:hypothetical protein [Actinoallomurus sp. CA-150999]|uniref:hypothetical protein n=1 Tax=Actinoallomurus sp. CA-150999 TaxID=3239887 RepID=UPI003D8F5102
MRKALLAAGLAALAAGTTVAVTQTGGGRISTVSSGSTASKAPTVTVAAWPKPTTTKNLTATRKVTKSYDAAVLMERTASTRRPT